MTSLAAALERQADELAGILGEGNGRFSEALATAAAASVGMLRAVAAAARDTEAQEAEPRERVESQLYVPASYAGEVAELIGRAYRDGFADGWSACLGNAFESDAVVAEHLDRPDPDAPEADQQRPLSELVKLTTTGRPGGFPPIGHNPYGPTYPGRSGG